jgi:acetyl-CoA synthetase
LLYTSGTSGKPKGVLHSNRFLLGHHALDLAFDRVRVDDVAYSPVDWAWGGGLMLGLLGPLAYGVPVVAFREPHFDPERAMQLMTALGVSIGLFPPTVLRMLRASGTLDEEAVDRSRLRCFITGAEAVEADLFAWAGSIGLGVNNAFGQTEANALIGHARVLGALDPAALGRPYPGHHVEVLDEDLQPVRGDEQGQLAVAAEDPVCMVGYWNAPDATAAKIRGGWLLTGDTAHRDDGVLYFHGRSDDIIKSGAYRLGPAEIEAAIRKSPLVEDCAVVGLPDPIRGEIVSAAVTLRPGAAASPELTAELRSLVRSSVGAHAYPRDVRYLDTLPKTTTGKVDRTTLRASLIAEGSPA